MNKAQELLERIADRNRLAALNEGRPEVGIFWIHPKTNELFGVHGEAHDTAIDDSLFLNTHHDHYQAWKNMKRQKALPEEFEYSEYEDVPRGRVIFDKEAKKHRVFGPTKQMKNPQVQSRILREFNLPKAQTIFADDVHYNPMF